MNETGKAVTALADAIRWTQVTTPFGIGVKLAALPNYYDESDLARILASVLADVDALTGEAFSSSPAGISLNEEADRIDEIEAQEDDEHEDDGDDEHEGGGNVDAPETETDFDRLVALHDALYSVLTPEQRRTFFDDIPHTLPVVRKHEGAAERLVPRQEPESHGERQELRLRMEDDLRQVGGLISAA